MEPAVTFLQFKPRHCFLSIVLRELKEKDKMKTGPQPSPHVRADPTGWPVENG